MRYEEKLINNVRDWITCQTNPRKFDQRCDQSQTASNHGAGTWCCGYNSCDFAHLVLQREQ